MNSQRCNGRRRHVTPSFTPRPIAAVLAAQRGLAAPALLLGALVCMPAHATDVPFATHTVSAAADGANAVFAADVDGDGDTDILSASRTDDKIAWYENDGAQNFTPHTISTTADVAFDVSAADLDGDGDIDVLSASGLDDTIAWYENDGDQNFTEHPITTAADGAYSVHPADVDGDGDVDVISTSRYGNSVDWYENGGAQNFTAHNIAADLMRGTSVFAADVDGDGDMDVLGSSLTDDRIAWYENQEPVDTAPDTFTFTDKTAQPTGTQMTSNSVTVTGINVATPISITGGTYRLNETGAFTSTAGEVRVGDTVRVRHTSSADASTSVDTVLTIGSGSDTFTSTTGTTDTTPAAYSFTDQTGVDPGTMITSNAITVTGINAPAPISIVGGRYRKNAEPFTTVAGTVAAGDSVRVQNTASFMPLTMVSTTLDIGGAVDVFTSTTGNFDVNPTPFSFPTLMMQPASTLVVSDPVTPTGYDHASPVRAQAGTEYSIDGGAFTSAMGTISPGQSVRVRHTTAATAMTLTTTGLKIGNVVARFRSRTN